MTYLTYDEFNELAPHIELEETEFNKLLPKASDVLNNVTSHFYARKDIEKDNLWRVKQFKKALCAQIEYFNEVGGTTHESINSAPQSFTAGRTTVSNSGRYRTDGESDGKTIVAEDVFVFLEGTGLLYRGVTVW